MATIKYTSSSWVNFRLILEQSVIKHGPDKPITTGHMLNIVKLANRMANEVGEQQEIFHSRLAFEIEQADAGCRD